MDELKKNGVKTVNNKKDARPNYSAWRFTFNTDSLELSPVNNAVYVYDADVYKEIDTTVECDKDNIDQICGTNLCNPKEDIEVNDKKLKTSLKFAIQNAEEAGKEWNNNIVNQQRVRHPVIRRGQSVNSKKVIPNNIPPEAVFGNL